MKRIILLLVLTSPALADERPIVPPRDAHPFGAIETRPLWQRPASDPTSVQQQTESALDRGTGRVEDQPSFDLRQLERDALTAPPDARAEIDRLRDEQDRQDRLDQRRLAVDREARRRRRIERESESLAAARRRWHEEVGRRSGARGAVVDRLALERVDQDHRAALDAAAQHRDRAAAALEANPNLTPDQRALGRATADREYELSRAAAARARAERRKLILGQ